LDGNLKSNDGKINFNAVDQEQRGALSLVNGTLYIPFGGYYGDGGNYNGWVVAVDTKNPQNVSGWATQGQKGGIWAPGGMASDGNGVFAITGNGSNDNGNHLDSEEVIRISALGTPNRDGANRFYPSIWKNMDGGDKDFGSCSPTVLKGTGGTPANLLIAPAKPGRVYFLDLANLNNNLPNLGGVNSGVMAKATEGLVVADTGAESVYIAPTAYKTASGMHVAISAQVAAVCPNNSIKDSQLMSILLDTSTNPLTPKAVWCADMATTNDDIRRRSPISTTTDGSSDAIVWYMNGSTLKAYDGETGDAITLGNVGACNGVQRHMSLIAVNGRIVAGANGQLCSWSIQ
jgi:hypothetical protein